MTDNVYTYIKSNVEPFLLTPPHTDFQRGYLAALLNVAEEALGLHLGKYPFKEAYLCLGATGTMHWLKREIARCSRDLKALKGEL
jgi:hypothetical protein